MKGWHLMPVFFLIMKKVNNPFSGKTGNSTYNCFGCSPENKAGLHLEFWLDGEEIVAKWMPLQEFEGWAGVVHGGIQGTLLDEAASWFVFVVIGTAGVTAEMQVKYLKPVLIANGEITIRARLMSSEDRVVKIKCTLEDGNGIVCTTSVLSYYCFPINVAKAKYHYPGVEAFINK